MDQEIAELTKAFAALGSVERVRIVSYLLARRGSHCGQIAQALGMSSSSFSYHLRLLEGAGLVARSRNGRLHCLSLTPVVKRLLPPGIRKKLTEEGTVWTRKSSAK